MDRPRQFGMRLPRTKNLAFPGTVDEIVIVTISPLKAGPESVGAPIAAASKTFETVILIASSL